MPPSLIKPILTIPPLENGDQLTLAEFEQRYQRMPKLKKAELIEGIVYMGSPLRINQHGNPHAHIITWLGCYEAVTSGVQLGDNCTVRLDTDNELQPDALLRIEQNGQSIISEDDYVEGAPELVVEIAASSASIDLHDKLKVYRRNQVQEYLVWRVYDNEFDWFRLKEGKYFKRQPNDERIIKSEIYSGLWLNVSDLLTGNLAKVLETLQQGITTADHRTFVQQLISS